MKEKRGRNHLETVFGVTALPSDTWIRAQMDKIAPEKFSGIFDSTQSIADRAGLIAGYRVLDGGVTMYYHSALAGAIVKPGSASVIPVMAEMIGNGDGEKKRD